MVKRLHMTRRLQQLEKRRKRTLKVRLPHIIRDTSEVENLFEDQCEVKLPRQSSKSCHVMFPDVESKIKNYNLAVIEGKTINGKRVVIEQLRPIQLGEKPKKVKRKKIYMQEIKFDAKPDVKITQTVFVTRIANSTKSQEVRDAFPGCVSVTLLNPYNPDFRSAMIRLESIELAEEYLTRKRKWPVLNGHKVYIKADTRNKHKKRASTGSLKIYGENGVEVPKSDTHSDCKKDKNESN